MKSSTSVITLMRLFMVVWVALLFTGCGANTTTPEAIAKSFYETAFSEKPQIEPYVCASNRAFADSMMTAMTAMKTQMNVSMFDTSGLKFEAGTQNSNTATVTVSGKVRGTVAGKPVEIDYPPTPITLKNENGWKICA